MKPEISERHDQYLRVVNSIYIHLLEEENFSELLQVVCDRLIENKFNQSARIVMIDDKSGNVTTAAAGRQKDCQQVMTTLNAEILPACGAQVLGEESGTVVFCSACDCDCRVLEKRPGDGGTVAVAINPGSDLTGFLMVQPPGGIRIDDDEAAILSRLAISIGIALHGLRKAIAGGKTFLQSIIDGARDPVMAIDMDYNILLINAAAAQIMGYDPWDARRRKCYKIFHNDDKPCSDRHFPCPIQHIQDTQGSVRLLHNPLHGNGINNTFELEVSPLRDEDGAIVGIIEVARDISSRLRIEEELRKSKSHLYRLAHHDTLTGLPNRLLFRDRLERAITKARRNQTLVAILFLDLDKFKVINDTLGHDVGDEILIAVAKRLLSRCRKSDTVARFGGDEFVFLLDDIANPEDIAAIALKVMDSLRPPISVGSHELSISTSIGIGIYPDDAEDIDAVIKCADLALYQAKNDGRNNFKYYQPNIITNEGYLPLLDIELPSAIERKEFFLEYQPQFDSEHRQVIGFEALLRWDHPDRGIIRPVDFIPLAVESGQIIALGKWILTEVCTQLFAWKIGGLNVVPVTVNVTLPELMEPNFVFFVTHLLLEYNLTPDLLELEFAESSIDENLDEILFGLERIAKLGIRLAIDDFGLGRSPMDYLQQLPLDRIKIDRSLIRHMPRDKHLTKIIYMIILMAADLGITVLAEGIENEEQLSFLKAHNCSQFQGFFLSMPISAVDAGAMLVEKGG